MLALLFATSLSAFAQQPSAPAPSDVTVLNARIDNCSADFTVKVEGKPVYGALIHVRARYGFLGVKRSDLEVSTSSAGKARIEGLPAKARPLFYDIMLAGKKAEVEQQVDKTCHATFDVALK